MGDQRTIPEGAFLRRRNAGSYDKLLDDESTSVVLLKFHDTCGDEEDEAPDAQHISAFAVDATRTIILDHRFS